VGPDGRAPVSVPWGLLVDRLSGTLLLVVTGVGFLIHVYSTSYMHEETDGEYARYFSYLNLFAAFMLVLVLGANFPVMFVGWEGVGLCSYLLIGFWFTKQSASDAGKKAFVVNRIGDFGFLLGIFVVWSQFGSLDFQEVARQAGQVPPEAAFGAVSLATLLLFVGATGKSAQIPLYVWLPDAMEGPTPVSALIHAATMVTAGVYMIGRNAVLFSHAPETLAIVAGIGVATALMAGTIGLVQNDIKRVLAYSTLSQLGLMFAAFGVGAFVASIFHLMTHGFFKGLLFLGSGSVIHAVHDEQDMNRMGGLWRKIPVTHWTMLIGTLALSGIPPLAGFFSKDEILGESFKFGFWWVFAIGITVAVMTAFYMFRLMGKTFYGSPSAYAQSIWDRIHEGPWTMLLPLVLLAIPSLLIGSALGLPLGDSTIKHWLEPVFAPAEHVLRETVPEYQLLGIDGGLIIASTAAATFGAIVSIWLFGIFRTRTRPATVARITAANPVTRFLYRASLNKWWFDDLYELLFIRIGARVADAFVWFDVRVVDGTVNGTGAVTSGAGRALRRVQTGRVQNYALGIAFGLVVMAGAYLFLASR
jgi:NADH-quinone oxidoreductase subunit L